MANRKIVKRTYYEIAVKLISPLNVGNGVEAATDADVMRNAGYECFVPGTSLAGAFRNYLAKETDNKELKKTKADGSKKRNSIFGFSDGEDGCMSSVYISDLYFDKKTVKTSVRDRVRLTEDKVVDSGGKFDIEIIEPAAKGIIRIETVQREGDADPDDYIDEIVLALSDGDIRIGAIKNRGFGRLAVESVRTAQFNSESRDKWIKYLDGDPNLCGKPKTFREWSKEKSRKVRFEKHSVHLRLTGGISIRRYSAQPGKADFEHITSNDKPVIPGTSWNGAVRADARQILKDLGLENNEAESLIEKWFGSLKKNESDGKKEGHQSRIVFSESVIEGSKPLPMTRNNINRFTAGTKDGALYTEISYIGGETIFEYMIEDDPNLKALKGMMKLIVKDICEGMLAIGGQVAVGRGIFEGKTEQLSTEDEDLRALYNEIRNPRGLDDEN